MKKVIITFPAAFVLFSAVFSGRVPVDFWWIFAAAISLLVVLTSILDPGIFTELAEDIRRKPLEKIIIAAASAAVLYVIFAFGNIGARLVLSGAPIYLQNVYALREGEPALKIVLLLAFVIGPGEEIFWRRFFQQNMIGLFGIRGGVIAAALAYSLAHVVSMNPLLLVAALVCGLFWGCLFAWKESLLVNIISHVLWDLTVFVWLPFH